MIHLKRWLLLASSVLALLTSFSFSMPLDALAAPETPTRFPAPPLRAPVTDEAGILDPTTVARLNQALSRLWESGGSQIAVLTVPTLHGFPIEQASIEIVDQWKLGTAKKDNGVLFLIAPNDRRMRIEVGQGLEGDLPDAIAKRIIAETVTPFFSEGRYNEGVIAGVAGIMERTDPNLLPQLEENVGGVPSRAPPKSRGSWVSTLIWLIVVWFFLFTRVGRALLFGMILFGGRGGGGYYGGGGSGGGRGYGGGGGGFSGGGASGSW